MQSLVFLDELIEFDLFWSIETARQTHSNKILGSSSWCSRGSLRRNYVLQARISKVEFFFNLSSSDVEYTLRNVYAACTTCAAKPATLTRTDEETSWVIQSIVIIVRLLLLDRWFTMIMKLTQFLKAEDYQIIYFWDERSHDYLRNKEKKSSNEVNNKLVRARRNRWVYEISSDVQDIPKMSMVASLKLERQKFPQYRDFQEETISSHGLLIAKSVSVHIR